MHLTSIWHSYTYLNVHKFSDTINLAIFCFLPKLVCAKMSVRLADWMYSQMIMYALISSLHKIAKFIVWLNL